MKKYKFIVLWVIVLFCISGVIIGFSKKKVSYDASIPHLKFYNYQNHKKREFKDKTLYYVEQFIDKYE